VPDIRAEVLRRGLVAQISDATIWRWLSDDAIVPWRHRSWIFPRAPDFEVKAGRVLDLDAGRFEGRRLRRCEPRSGIESFGWLVAQVMAGSPSASARRVFWIVDNGSSHRERASVERLENTHPNLRLIHLPIHAS
jgi:hypothetical protein